MCFALHGDSLGNTVAVFHEHCRFDECVIGGNSQLVDMFHAMEILRQESPEYFHTLTRVPCTFSTIDYKRKSPAYLITRKPIIQVDYDDQVITRFLCSTNMFYFIFATPGYFWFVIFPNSGHQNFLSFSASSFGIHWSPMRGATTCSNVNTDLTFLTS